MFAVFSDYSIFLPPKPTTFTETATTHTIQVGDHAHIKATYLPVEGSEYTLLYSHGNAEDLGRLDDLFKIYQAKGFSIFAYDYQGYGLSDGKPSQSRSYKDIEAAYRYLNDKLHIPPKKIIAYGRSLGGGPTVELASKYPVGGVILEATFTSAYRVVTRYPVIPFDKYKNLSKIKKINCPLLVIHGSQDSIISDYHGKKLFSKANEPKFYYEIKGADHNDLIQVAKQEYWDKLNEFINSLAIR